MPGFVLRLLISAFALWVAAWVVPGMHIEGAATLGLAALLLGFVNAIVRPVVLIFTLPLTLLSLGLFLFVINAMMLGLVAWLLADFHVSGFFSALFGSIVVSLASGFGSWMVGDGGKVEKLEIIG